MLHKNITLTDDDAIRTKAVQCTGNRLLERCIVVASAAEYLSAEVTDQRFDNGLFVLMVKIKYLAGTV